MSQVEVHGDESANPAVEPQPDRLTVWLNSLSHRRLALALVLGTFLLHFLGNWTLPLCDRDEPRFAEASREMLQRGDWVVPWFNNRPRYDKPPLIYWCQAAAYQLFGENELSARLPSAVASALVSLVIFGFGCRWRDKTTGFWAAIFFATCVQTIVHSRLAVADMLMILFFTTASWCAWELPRGNPSTLNFNARRAWWWGLVLSLALAFLAKGPIGLLPILFPFLAARQQKLLAPLATIRPVWVTVCVLLLVAAWGVPALIQTHGEFWNVGMGRHVFYRSVAVLEGHGAKNGLLYLITLPIFFITVFVSFFPWSIWLPGLVKNVWSRRKQLDSDESFLVLGILSVFLIFSLVRTKLPHYTLPAFPLLCLLLAKELPLFQMTRTLTRWTGGMVVLVLVLAFAVFPLIAPYFPSKELAKRCAPWLKPEMEFATSGYEEGSLFWYVRGTLSGFSQKLRPVDLPAFMEQPGSRLCILRTPEVASTFPEIPAHWQRVQVQGFNLGNGRWVDLTALIKPE